MTAATPAAPAAALARLVVAILVPVVGGVGSRSVITFVRRIRAILGVRLGVIAIGILAVARRLAAAAAAIIIRPRIQRPWTGCPRPGRKTLASAAMTLPALPCRGAGEWGSLMVMWGSWGRGAVDFARALSRSAAAHARSGRAARR